MYTHVYLYIYIYRHCLRTVNLCKRIIIIYTPIMCVFATTQHTLNPRILQTAFKKVYAHIFAPFATALYVCMCVHVFMCVRARVQ